MTWFVCWSACMLLISNLRCSITVFYQSHPTSCCLPCLHVRSLTSTSFAMFVPTGFLSSRPVQCMSYIIYHSFSVGDDRVTTLKFIAHSSSVLHVLIYKFVDATECDRLKLRTSIPCGPLDSMHESGALKRILGKPPNSHGRRRVTRFAN